ncbi:uncharacterized protein LOC130664936 [Microplitis mediator]|uniref:uncharacterized protein LOC130664936 n=1 Tax=Microplitis mediator TaxID=375433 RepID=UPI002557224B|nr:uncharacterized protein LOC130664936 [Microplitis mediator]
MKCTETFKYHVVQFLELPYKGIDEYVCVPSTWIVLRRKIDQKVIVAYPVENPSDTAKRVKRRQKRSDDWKLYLSVVKYSTDVYEDAEIFINEKVNDVYYEYKSSNMKNKDRELTAPVEKKTRRPTRNSKLNHEIDKPVDLVVTSMNDDKSETKRPKRTALPTSDTEPALKRSKVVKLTESVSNGAEQPSQAFGCLSEHQPSPTREDFPMQNSCSSEISMEESDDRSSVEDIEHVENSDQERPSVIQNFPNLTNSLSNTKLLIDSTFLTELFTVIRNQHKMFANSLLVVDNLRRVIVNNAEALRDVKQLIADSRSSNSDNPTTSLSTNTTVEIEKISEKNQSKQQQQQEEYENHLDVNMNEVPKKRRSQKRKFVLPRDYDKNDSRWTLKHRRLVPGVVELMPHTNVYINFVALSNCKRLAKDCKSLARMLLVEIFTKSALSVCSLTGSRARAYDIVGATVRPGLDENARTVLLSYVEEYGRAKDWITVDTSSIQNSLRNKMQEFRFKYG